jgi:hypothetical protein
MLGSDLIEKVRAHQSKGRDYEADFGEDLIVDELRRL